MRIEVASKAAQAYVSFPAGSSVLGVAADQRYLWAAVKEGPALRTVIDRIGFTDGAITRYATAGVDVVGDGQLISAGLWLYAPAVGNHGLLRFSKLQGTWGQAVGGTAGDADGVWTRASFGRLVGIASDGHDLWVTDTTNRQLREVSFSQVAGLGL